MRIFYNPCQRNGLVWQPLWNNVDSSMKNPDSSLIKQPAFYLHLLLKRFISLRDVPQTISFLLLQHMWVNWVTPWWDSVKFWLIWMKLTRFPAQLFSIVLPAFCFFPPSTRGTFSEKLQQAVVFYSDPLEETPRTQGNVSHVCVCVKYSLKQLCSSDLKSD